MLRFITPPQCCCAAVLPAGAGPFGGAVAVFPYAFGSKQVNSSFTANKMVAFIGNEGPIGEQRQAALKQGPLRGLVLLTAMLCSPKGSVL